MVLTNPLCMEKGVRVLRYFYFTFYIQTSERLSKFLKFLSGSGMNKGREVLLGVRRLWHINVHEQQSKRGIFEVIQYRSGTFPAGVSELVSPTDGSAHVYECECDVCSKSIPAVRQQ